MSFNADIIESLAWSVRTESIAGKVRLVPFMRNSVSVRFGAAVLAGIAVLASGGCSLRSMAVNAIVPTLANPDVYLSEEDPELVRDALPFLLKTIESILDTEPEQDQALVFACTGFMLYGNAFLQADAEIADWEGDYERSSALRDRTWRVFVRARDYCLRSLELKYDGIAAQLQQDPVAALAVTDVEDVEVLFLLSAAWGLAISNALDQPGLIADLPAVRALLDRALELDEDYERGSLHAALITLEALPAQLGGSPDRAREHFERAVELSDGLDAGPYVTFAAGVSVPEENRAEFQRLLETALAVDPDADTSLRLLNLVSQRRARSLLGQIDDLFFDPLETEATFP
ncbi:MAG TPA: hypothetical protein EYQ83_21405 [Acidobacteria bacterium]|nr:hypothetical protein [Acidobacteriota bacterium]